MEKGDNMQGGAQAKQQTFRILIVDDEQDILNTYKKILDEQQDNNASEDRLHNLEAKLFNHAEDSPSPQSPSYQITYCNQGNKAFEAVVKAKSENSPYAVAFLDVRMPPGPDGVDTAQKIRGYDPLINIVIVTAYSDIAPKEIAQKVSPPDKLLYMQKPFHSHEIQQFTAALTAKWATEKALIEHNQVLDQKVKDKTAELLLAVESLEIQNSKYKQLNEALQEAEQTLALKARDLSGAKTALQQLAQQNEEERKEIEKKVLFGVHEMVSPYLDNIEKSGLDAVQTSFLKIIRLNLEEIVAPFMKELSHKYFRLSPTEISVANLIKQGHTTKEIAAQLNTTKRNIDFYRDQIREKIGIKNTKANLKNVLQEMELDLSK